MPAGRQISGCESECLDPAASHFPPAAGNQGDQIKKTVRVGVPMGLTVLPFFLTARNPPKPTLAASLAEIRSLFPGFAIITLNSIFGPQLPSHMNAPGAAASP